MSSSLPPSSLFSNLLFSYLLSLLFPLLLFSSSPISSAASVNADTSTSSPASYKLLPSADHPHNQKCVQQHLSSLLQLKRGFNLTLNSTCLSSWNANNPDCCSWEGITCNSSTGHVIGLNLSDQVIGGLLNFQSLFQLGSLQRLDLSGNDFDGSPIPSGFAQLRNLTHLHLSSSQFYGRIPLDIFHLTRLVSLDLSYNSYNNGSDDSYVMPESSSVAFLYLESSSSGTEQLFGNLSGLRELFLDIVDFSAIGNQWSQVLSYAFPNLRTLSLFECRLSGPINPSLSRLHLLTLLDLTNNHLSSPVPESLSNLTSLTSLSLSGCGLYHKFPTSIFNLPKLQSLDISGNQFLRIYFPKFSMNSTIQQLLMSGTDLHGNLADIRRNFLSLTHLDVSRCNLLGPIPESYTNFSRLVSLDLSKNNIQGSIPSLIFTLTSLTFLSMSSNHFSGVVDLGFFQNLEKLNRLDLSHNNFSAIANTRNSSTSFFQPCVNLSPLTDLDLSSNNFQGPIPRVIFELTQLWRLRLSSNHFSGVVDLCSFQNLQKLEWHNLSYNDFLAIVNTRNSSASFIQPCVKLSQLTDLDLSNNNFQGPIPRFIFELPQLWSLWLSSNNFTGFVDLSLLQNLKNLGNLDLSDNSLTVFVDPGSSLKSTSFPRMWSLYLSSCNISKFPNMLRNQGEIQALDLSRNRIHGKIPQWIWKVGNGDMLYLNLSSNALEGLEGPFPYLSLTSMAFLDLSNNLLRGLILIPPPSSLVFSLANNSLHGEVPSVICDAKFLRVLDLSNNNFTGLIPQCLGEISNGTLAVLNLGQNAFHGPLLQTFRVGCTLETLDLSGNHLEGQMPKSLANCQMLTVLNLGNNQIHDEFPSQLGNLSNLHVLVLRSNKFFGSIGRPWASQGFFPQLQIIDLSSNNFSGRLPSNLFSAWKMMKEGGSASEFLAPGTARYYQHKVFLVRKGTDVEFVKILITDTVVDLSHNQFDGDIPTSIGELKARLVLILSYNRFQGEIPSVICDAKFLRVLDLSNNNFTGLIPQCLGEISSGTLVVLNLGQNAFHGPLLQTFKVGCTLETLDLSGNHLEGQMPKSLANCQMLKVLNLGNNQIQDEFPSELGNLSNLHVLVLRSNKFFGSIAQPWTSQEFFPWLQIIDLSFNNLSGGLPSNFFSAWKIMKDGGPASEFLTPNATVYYQDKVFLVWKGTEIEFVKILMADTVVDLSHNQFDGDIPTSIGELKALILLNLSHNHFQGEIPASLQNLRHLESLDLSSNNLSGKIPWQLTELSFLAVLDLSQNQLIGEIPQGKQFNTFGDNSFLGNSGLCGLPLSRKCKEDDAAGTAPATESEEESEVEFMWMGFGVGHGVGFGMFFWTLALSRRGRGTFLWFVDRVLFPYFCSGVELCMRVRSSVCDYFSSFS